jgi:hypothetical protein
MGTMQAGWFPWHETDNTSRHADRDGVQDDGAVRVQRAFRVSGRTGGVAKDGRRALVKFRPFKPVAVPRKQIFIAQNFAKLLDDRHVCGVAQCHPGFSTIDRCEYMAPLGFPVVPEV